MSVSLDLHQVAALSAVVEHKVQDQLHAWRSDPHAVRSLRFLWEDQLPSFPPTYGLGSGEKKTAL